MTHFGAICPTHFTGHLNTMLPLAQELKRRDHRVTFIGIVGYEAKVLAAGLEFIGLGQKEFPPGVNNSLIIIQVLENLCPSLGIS